ncbi:SGNH/GDSL hydrolase family protein [Flavobacterium algicola]|uniref:SGNH/GDSL hydrolase family protein n=1 Tax=Flavobacterium algicola TaxID=556529 RepID=UPI001EFDAC9A|nr:SGNH/GDSL hydrolase family protein [Flavobacterium algicola]MCG9792832.1 SGNH/GDSL hydrolase family protein [Flavobacterium algicola]
MKRKEFIQMLGLSIASCAIVPNLFANKIETPCDEEICNAAWTKLCGNSPVVYKNDAFNYVHPVDTKLNVLLYGDSISIAYTPEVRERLKDNASVFRLHTNGGSSRDFISNMLKMEETMFQPNLVKGWDFKWDIIHFNVGLHDLKYLKGKNLNKKEGVQVSSITDYKTNLDEICKFLKTKFPKAKLIFATTTPVPANEKGRFEGDSIKYNKAAMDILVNHPDITINDLYSFSKPHFNEWTQGPGNVHYNEIGYTKQGDRVAKIIFDNL